PGAGGELPRERRADRRTVPYLVATLAGRKDLDAALDVSAGARRAAVSRAGHAGQPAARGPAVGGRARPRGARGGGGDNGYISCYPVGAAERPRVQRPVAAAYPGQPGHPVVIGRVGRNATAADRGDGVVGGVAPGPPGEGRLRAKAISGPVDGHDVALSRRT